MNCHFILPLITRNTLIYMFSDYHRNQRENRTAITINTRLVPCKALGRFKAFVNYAITY